jgi:shikimate kinase
VAVADRPIALVGFMASGKSKIGRDLAARLSLPFTDTDEEIERSFGMPITHIFTRLGEPEFRKAERETVLRLLSGPAQVISLGGGAFQDETTRRDLQERATTVWLDPPFEILLGRLARSDKRPLATGRTPAELRQLWQHRREAYAAADYRLVTSDGDPALAVDRLIEMLAA